jgi:asparagine synthase (glutamine-hydrolysing)
MSGFVGIINFDDAPVDRQLLDRMTAHLAYRGPDAQEIWCERNAGLGHALLRTTREARRERQPFTLGSRFRIVADVRMDARAELVAAIRARPQHAAPISLDTPDVELLLHAYEVWGEACVEHLLGDFSFAIWDSQSSKLFCARDHFGIRPFFYANVGETFIFSNSLDCLRLHPTVSSHLDDLAIADFLLFDSNQDPAGTAFQDIRRLPPAHRLEVSPGGIAARRFWRLSAPAPLQYAREEEYIEHFHVQLDTAVSDRLRTDCAAVLMSGGLDSPTVAVSARRIFDQTENHTRLSACTEVFDSLIPHEERRYATLVAAALKMPIECLPGDQARIFGHALQPSFHSPEPCHSAWPDVTVDHLRAVARTSRVVLTGLGADPAMSSSITVHFRELFASRQYARLLSDAFHYFRREGRLSRLYLAQRWQLLFAFKRHAPFYPPWLNEDLERRLALRDRWETLSRSAQLEQAVRPEAQQALLAPSWTSFLEEYDCGFTHVPVEVRHPFFDLRLLNFLLGLPRLPWCSDKQLFREAARGTLPEAVRLRRKSPLQEDLLVALLKRPDSAWVDQFAPAPQLEPFVMRSRIPPVYREELSWKAWIHLRPLSLNFWLCRHEEIDNDMR